MTLTPASSDLTFGHPAAGVIFLNKQKSGYVHSFHKPHRDPCGSQDRLPALRLGVQDPAPGCTFVPLGAFKSPGLGTGHLHFLQAAARLAKHCSRPSWPIPPQSFFMAFLSLPLSPSSGVTLVSFSWNMPSHLQNPLVPGGMD